MSKHVDVLVLGSFVVDVAFRTPRLPSWGETILGSALSLGPGGKGSNQAVAAARAGASVTILSKLANDPFGQIARQTWAADGIDDSHVLTSETPTGAAAILIDQATGENAIVITPGACYTLTPSEVEASATLIQSAAVFLAQLELPLEVVATGLHIARKAGVVTVLNPAPAPSSLSNDIIALADFIIPNESEAATLAGLPVTTVAQAEAAADAFLARGACNVIITLGANGSLLRTRTRVTTHIPARNAGPVLDTTGAGDAYCGAFSAAIARGQSPIDAMRFATAAAAISVTRQGTAPSMPHLHEINTIVKMSYRD